MQGIAKVTLLGQRTKEFCMWQVRRYDPKSIIQCMRNLDWEPVAQIPFIGTKTRPKSVFMFQKRMPR